MMRMLTPFLLVLFFAVESNAQLQSEISVSAEANVYTKPDVAEFSLSIVARQPKATDAFETYLERYDALVSSLRDVVDTTKLLTNNLSITPSFDYKNPDQVNPNYYQVSSSMSISVQVSKLNKVLGRVASVDGVTINGITFQAKNPDSLETIALKEAVEKAHDKAEEVARLDGFSNIKLRTMNTSYSRPPVPIRGEAMMVNAQMGPSVNPSTVSVSANVGATYTAY